jgi:hypothetical protein
MKRPRRIVLSRRKGWRKPPNTVVVARPSKWGNPFRPMPGYGRAECVATFEEWLHTTPAGTALGRAAQAELKGRNLACWCSLGGPCHADILLRVANAA